MEQIPILHPSLRLEEDFLDAHGSICDLQRKIAQAINNQEQLALLEEELSKAEAHLQKLQDQIDQYFEGRG